MERVAVVGSGGAAKTTFSAELGLKTGLPVIHLDQLYWSPAWVKTPSKEWETLQTQQLSSGQWIADGNYGGTFEIRFRQADTIIVLALPRWLCI